MKYCPYCGAGLQDEMNFCPSCGKKYIGAAGSGAADADAVKAAEPAAPETATAPAADAVPAKKKSPKRRLFALAGILVVVAAVFLLFGRSTPAPEPTPEPTPEPLAFSDDTAAIQSASNSVVMLSCYDRFGDLSATGSAFTAFEDGVFVTNFHVLEGEVYSIRARTESGIEFDIKSVIAYDEQRDIAILRAKDTPELSPLPLSESSEMEKGEKVVAIGSPLGLLNSVSTGVYSGTTREGGQDYLQFSAPISHGSSGGALFNNAGEVIGVTSASYEAGQNLNLALPIQFVSRLWSLHQNDKPQIINVFYDSFDHIFSVDYVLAHVKEFDGETVSVQGFVSYYEHHSSEDYLILVSSPAEVLGGSNSSPEISRLYSLGSIFCFFDTERITASAGDYVSLKGTIYYVSEENSYAGIVHCQLIH